MMPSVAERLNAGGSANALELRGVTRMFGALAALTDVTINVRPGERRAAAIGGAGNDVVQLHHRRLPPTSGPFASART